MKDVSMSGGVYAHLGLRTCATAAPNMAKKLPMTTTLKVKAGNVGSSVSGTALFTRVIGSSGSNASGLSLRCDLSSSSSVSPALGKNRSSSMASSSSRSSCAAASRSLPLFSVPSSVLVGECLLRDETGVSVCWEEEAARTKGDEGCSCGTCWYRLVEACVGSMCARSRWSAGSGSGSRTLSDLASNLG